MNRKQFTVTLSTKAAEYVEYKAKECQTNKSAIVDHCIAFAMADERDALLKEGYEEYASTEWPEY